MWHATGAVLSTSRYGKKLRVAPRLLQLQKYQPDEVRATLRKILSAEKKVVAYAFPAR
jgi:hypothetical protein